MSDLADTYNRIAKDWHRDHSTDDWWQEGMDVFISFLHRGDQILDVGCAGGMKSRYLIDKGLSVDGIDISENFITIAKKEVPEGNFFVHDMRQLSEISEVYDAVMFAASLLHIPKTEVESVLKGAHSILKPGGIIYVAVKEQYPDGPEEKIAVENDYGYEYERFFSFFTQEELRKYLESTSFEVIHESISKRGKTSWLQTAGKKI